MSSIVSTFGLRFEVEDLSEIDLDDRIPKVRVRDDNKHLPFCDVKYNVNQTADDFRG